MLNKVCNADSASSAKHAGATVVVSTWDAVALYVADILQDTTALAWQRSIEIIRSKLSKKLEAIKTLEQLLSEVTSRLPLEGNAVPS